MCGINGFVSLTKSYNMVDESALQTKIESMNDKIIHRGPDSGGCYINNPIVFGFRRLSIIDLDDHANQPMISDNGNLALVFNGEIYNYVEIKNELIAKGITFKTSSDTEVILKSYEFYGEKCVEHFNGMWAFAIYDFNKNRLFCSRDRLGVKPFYYSIQNNELFFSSELKAIHTATSTNTANLNRVYEYLAYGYRMNNGETFFENCSELLPGTNLILENGEIRLEKYWTLKNDLYQHDNSENYNEEFSSLFKSAVKLRYRSDVPVALLLSGGLDSTAIARVTDDLIENGELETNEINAFIASFPGFVDDETDIAREFIKTCKHIKLHEIQVDSKKVLEDFEKLIYDLDHPLFSFNTVVHNSIMRECHNRGIKVVLNGQGADEALAGYVKYISGFHLADALVNGKGFFKEYKALLKKNNFSRTYLLKQILKAIISPSTASFLRAKYQEKIIPCLSNKFVAEHKSQLKTDYKFSLRGDNLNNYLLDKINNQGLNMILHYEDVSSMNQSVEIRSPFMDYRFMEFAFSIPNEFKFKEGVTKKILRDTVGKLLPDSITKNRKKIGFQTPFYDYLTEDENLKNYISKMIVSDSFTNKKIWNAKKLKEIFENPDQYPEFPFWRVINLEIWSKTFGITNL